jgi:hypothetical protein
MKSGDILHVVWRTPVLVVTSGPAAGDASLMRTGMFGFPAVAAPARTIGISSQTTLTSWHDNRVQLCRHTATASSAFAAPTPAGTISERSEIAALPRTPDPSISAPPPPRAATIGKIELAIESLQDYDLAKPIPVLIESLGDKVFVAESLDLNLSTTGNSVGAAFTLLKEQIITTYEACRSKKASDPQRAQQLAAFEQYIGKPRRHWF